MIVLAVIHLVCVAAFFTGIAVSPDHVLRGFPAAVSFFGMVASGLVLAVGAL